MSYKLDIIAVHKTITELETYGAAQNIALHVRPGAMLHGVRLGGGCIVAGLPVVVDARLPPDENFRLMAIPAD